MRVSCNRSSGDIILDLDFGSFKDWRLSDEASNASRLTAGAPDVPDFPRLGNMFYIVFPEYTTFKTVQEVPLFFKQAWPYFLMFMLVENILLWLEKKPLMRINDGIVSLSHGLIQELGRVVTRGAESWAYIWIHENWRLVDLPWDDPLTWYLAAIGVDFAYYWLHRACHEIHILWAQHQVHHSSEDYNLAVGLRQSVLQSWCGFLFYLPLAVAVPPAQFLTHQQFNLLYQFWIHTETIPSLGPLEWILNTPRHHRVHHGSVIWALDKNYGGTLIIWDRLFGTFAEDKPKEEMVYGLVVHEASFNPVYLQYFYNKNVINKVKSMTGWNDKVSAVFKGPSWLPGRPWAGCDADKIDVKPRVKYDPKLPIWCNIYLVMHFIAVVLSYHDLAQRYGEMSPMAAVGFVSYVLGSLTLIGLLLEDRRWAYPVEGLRCALLALALHRSWLAVALPFIKWFFLSSALFWGVHFLRHLRLTNKTKQE